MVVHALTSAGHDASEDGTGRGTPLIVVNALDRMAGGPDDNSAQAGHLVEVPRIAGTLGSGQKQGGRTTDLDNHGAYIPAGSSVRRLTPRECERLQGFPSDWTAIDWQGKPAADSRRYAACGDAVTVPVAEWLGMRLARAIALKAAA